MRRTPLRPGGPGFHRWVALGRSRDLSQPQWPCPARAWTDVRSDCSAGSLCRVSLCARHRSAHIISRDPRDNPMRSVL